MIFTYDKEQEKREINEVSAMLVEAIKDPLSLMGLDFFDKLQERINQRSANKDANE